MNIKYLLAVSGGIDSMVLLDIFHKLNLSFHIAHANFQLRGKESEQDEIFVYEQSKKYLVNGDKIHVQRFDTLEELQNKTDTSIQMLARELRYQWFNSLLKEKKLDYIVTAHHADDNIETFFLKLFRKSSIGLSGMDILSKKRIFRPLLVVFRSEIQEYAQKHNIMYREDSSNTKDDYLRNHVRHHLIPFIEQHYPTAKSAILDTMQYQKEMSLLSHTYIQEIWQKSTQIYEDCYTIDLNILQQYPQDIQPLLPWHFAEKLNIGMKQFEQFKHLFDTETQSGKQMVTQTHKAVRYKQTIQVFPINKYNTDSVKSYHLKEKNKEILLQLPKEYILIRSDFSNSNNDTIFTSVRLWYAGDKILYKGKEQLIADLIPKFHITPYQKEYLYVATLPCVENDEPHPILNPYQGIKYSEKIVFAFFCPNSVLLQLD